MSFKDQIKTDFFNIFLNPDEFAEEISYTPKGGASKTIKAIIVRQRLDTDQLGRGQILQNQAEIYIARDVTLGIASVNKGDDEVSFSEIPGEAAISWAVIDILKATEAFWHLRVRK